MVRTTLLESPVIDCAVDSVLKIVHITVSGELEGLTLADVAKRLAREPNIGDEFSQLIDLRQARSARVSVPEIQALASLGVRSTTRRAIVVSDSLTFGLVRLFQAHRESHDATDRIALFRDMRSAEAWLIGDHLAAHSPA
jgi:hypothetical protein